MKKKWIRRFTALFLAACLAFPQMPVRAADMDALSEFPGEDTPEVLSEVETGEQTWSVKSNTKCVYTDQDEEYRTDLAFSNSSIVDAEGNSVRQGEYVPGQVYFWQVEEDWAEDEFFRSIYRVVGGEAVGLELTEEEQAQLDEVAINGGSFSFTMPDNDVVFYVVEYYLANIEDGQSAGGRVEAEPSQAAVGESVSIRPVPEEGYEFAGWKSVKSSSWTMDLSELDADASQAENGFTVVREALGDNASRPRYIYVEAEFQKIEGTKFHVAFTSEEGSGDAPASLEKAEGETFQLPQNPYVNEGRSFLGWWDGEALFQPGDTYTMPHKQVTFTAQWRDSDSYDVYFQAEEDSELTTLGIEAKKEGETFQLPQNSFSHSGSLGYDFTGWWDGEKLYQPGDTYTMREGQVVFTAQWERYYKITYYTANVSSEFTLIPSDTAALRKLTKENRAPVGKLENLTWGIKYYTQPSYFYAFDGITINGVSYTEDAMIEDSEYFSGTVKVHILGCDAPGDEGYAYAYVEFLDGEFQDDVVIKSDFTKQPYRSNTAEITGFSVGGAQGTIDHNEIQVRVGDEEDLKHITPQVEISEGAAVTPASGEEQDFTDPVLYTVTSKNGKVTRSYRVTVVKLRDTIAEAAPGQINKGISSYRDSAGAILGSESLLPQVSSTRTDWMAFVMGRYGYVQDDGSVSMLYEDEEGREAFLEAMKSYVEKTYQENGGILSKSKATEWQRAILAIAALGGDPTNFGTYNGQPIDLVADGTYNCKIEPGTQGVNGEAFALLAKNTKDYNIPDEVSYSDEYLITSILSKQLNFDGRYEGWNVTASAKSTDPDMTAMVIQALAPYYWDDTEYTFVNIKTGETLVRTVRDVVDEALYVLSEIQTEYGDYICYGDRNVESTVQVLVAVTSLGIDPLTDERFIKNGNTLIDAIQNFAVSSGGYEHMLGGGWNYMATDQANYGMIAAWRYLNGMRNLYDMRPEFTEEQKSQIQSLKDTIDKAVAKKGEDGYYEALLSAKETYDTAVAGFEDGTMCNYISNYWELMDALEAAEEEQEGQTNEAVKKVTDLIDAIGEVTLDSEAAIQAAWDAYQALTLQQQELVENYQTLADARETYEELVNSYEAFTTGVPQVKAEALAYNTVKVTWEPYENSKSYYVYRKTAGSSFKKLAWIQDLSDLSYTDETAEPGTAYYYTVKAASKNWGDPVYSKYVTNLTVKTSLGQAVITQTQTWGYNGIKVTWDKVAGATGYRLYYQTGSSAWKYVTQTSASSYVHSPVTTGQTYKYYVRAYRTVDGQKVYGAYSEGKSGKAVPKKCVITKATAGSKKAALSWNKVNGASGYRIYYKTSENGAWTYVTQVGSGSTASYTAAGLKSGQTYYFTMRAYRTVNGEKVYGAYADWKTVKVK